ncbi:MAG TPA: hypothetical protein VGB76_19035 [Pyrinomonadaceae bacterium]|jgi:hypothetical protein
MKRINSVTYEVLPGEKLSIKVTPTNFGPSAPAVEADLDGTTLTNTGTKSKPVYKFTVNKQDGETNLVTMEFVFQFDSPDESFYAVAISGQNDVGCPCGFTVAKPDEDHGAEIAFDVVEEEE